MYQVEHDEMFAAIRAGKPINNGEQAAHTTLLALMGRTAAYTGTHHQARGRPQLEGRPQPAEVRVRPARRTRDPRAGLHQVRLRPGILRMAGREARLTRHHNFACAFLRRSCKTFASGSTTIRSGSKGHAMTTSRVSPLPSVIVVRASRYDASGEPSWAKRSPRDGGDLDRHRAGAGILDPGCDLSTIHPRHASPGPRCGTRGRPPRRTTAA